MIYGAIIGDIIGSRYEIYTTKNKDFDLFPEKSIFTDDTVMTIAVASALIKYKALNKDIDKLLINEMQNYGKKYPNCGYGMAFKEWINSGAPKPYNSYGNGSAMRVSPCGLAAKTLEEAMFLAEESAKVSHSHPEGIKGAQAVAAAVYLAKTHKSKSEILDIINDNFYPLKNYPSIEGIRKNYKFHLSCQESVPEAILAFIESTSYEDAIRNAVSLGGDADTQAAIAGGIASVFYCRDSVDEEYEKHKNIAKRYLPKSFIHIADLFNKKFC